ncbi:MAG: sensor histidine kinase [Acidobacteriota bacterium]
MSGLRLNSLAVRLTGTLIVVLALLLVITGLVQVSLQERFAHQCSMTNGLLLSETLYGALHTRMLDNDSQGLHESVQSLAERVPNLRVRIFNKEGLIVFSSNSKEIGTKLDPRSEACYKCHAAGRPIEKLPPGDRTRSFRLNGVPALGVIRPIENEPACSNAACHAHPKEKRLLGVLDVTLLLGPAQQAQRQTTGLMLGTIGGVLVLVVAVVVGVLHRTVRRPIHRLSDALDALGSGDFSARYENHDITEFARLGTSLNNTAQQLQAAHAELVDWAQTLERRVDEKTAELRRAQEQMIRIERMASLGKLAAVVAHEINNPLASVVTYSRLLLRKLVYLRDSDEQRAEISQILEAIATESARCGEIVSNLLLFARRTGSRFEPTNLNDVVGKVMFLIKHKIDLAQVKSVLELAPAAPEVMCDPSQLEQALLALTINAIEAMPEGGTLTIASRPLGQDAVQLEIADTGSGIDESARAHIFEPFFTTKTDGESKGLGLGLAVVYGIVQRHGGTIDVDSVPGRGTRFTITLPTQPPREREPE